MRELLDQMRAATAGGFYLVGLMIALAIPDMCGALSSPDGKASGSKYRQWLVDHGGRATEDAAIIYKFRCSLLHQGSAQVGGLTSQVACVEPGQESSIHNLVTNVDGHKVMWYDIPTFVEEVAQAAEKWLDAYESTVLVQKNIQRFVHRRPEGLPPHVVGGAVIA